MTEEQIELLKEFTIFQYMRTLGENLHLKKMSYELYYTITKLQFPNLPDNIIKEVINNNVEEENTADHQVELAKQLVKEISDLNLKVVYNITNEPFITSDIPIVYTNAFSKDGGFASIGAIMFFPISEKHLIVIYDDKMYKNVESCIGDFNEIKKINQYQVLSADEKIISKSQDTLKKYYKDVDVINKRNHIRDAKVTTNSYGINNDEIIIAAKNRTVHYDIHLKLFSLPIQYKRIPLEAREPFPRKYNIVTRNYLLFRVGNIRNLYT